VVVTVIMRVIVAVITEPRGRGMPGFVVVSMSMVVPMVVPVVLVAGQR